MTEENQKPNFDFIMNQPGPEPADPSRKGRKGLFFAVIAGVGVLIGVGVIFTFLSMKPVNVKPIEDNVRQYYSDMSQKNYTNAYNLISTGGNKVPENLYKLVVDTANVEYKLDQCAIKGTTYQDPIYTTQVSCPQAKVAAQTVFSVESKFANKKPFISKISTQAGVN